MNTNDYLKAYQDLRAAGEFDDAATLAETFTWQLVVEDRIPEALSIITQTIERATNPLTLCQAWARVGHLLYQKGFYDRARIVYHAALNYCTATDDIEQARLRYSIGTTYSMEDNYESACAWYEDSIRISERCNDTEGIAYTATQLTDVCKHVERSDDAQRYARQAIIASLTIGKAQQLEDAVEKLANLAKWIAGTGNKAQAKALVAFAQTQVQPIGSPHIAELLQTAAAEVDQ
jgi:tetratricopeptide (TPR) repeat protein